MSEDETGEADPPVLRVVKGEPTTEELAALVSVLARRNDAAAALLAERTSRLGTRSAWGDPARAARHPLRVGPDGWRRSALPG